MSKSKAYRSSDVNDVDVARLVNARDGQRAWIGVDIGKFEALAVLRWSDGGFERPWRVANPEQLGVFARLAGELSSALKSAGGELLGVGLEPSGTYGDALRQALADAGVAAWRVSPKAAHDYAEVFDGAPSQLDAKDAAVVAELCAIGKGDPWPYLTAAEAEQEVGYWVERMDARRLLLQVWCGRLESRLARHWPEATRWLPVGGATLLKTLARFGGPSALAADPDAAATLRRFCAARLTEETIRRVIASAASSVGVRQTAWDQRQLKELAEQAMQARKQIAQARRELRRAAAGHDSIQAMATVVGLPSACVLWVCCGSPKAYSCGNAYRKALGLNLVERSSGTFQGKLKISKRGKAMARRWLYFAAVRWVNDPRVRTWYQRKKLRDGSGMPALIAVMGKLSKALYLVGGQGVKFDAARLFPGVTPTKQAQAAGAIAQAMQPRR